MLVRTTTPCVLLANIIAALASYAWTARTCYAATKSSLLGQGQTRLSFQSPPSSKCTALLHLINTRVFSFRCFWAIVLALVLGCCPHFQMNMYAATFAAAVLFVLPYGTLAQSSSFDGALCDCSKPTQLPHQPPHQPQRRHRHRPQRRHRHRPQRRHQHQPQRLATLHATAKKQVGLTSKARKWKQVTATWPLQPRECGGRPRQVAHAETKTIVAVDAV